MDPEYSSSNDLSKLKSFNAYILIFNTIQQWKKWLSAIFHHMNWSPGAKFSATFQEDVNITEVFEIAWWYNLINFNLFSGDGVYTYFPYNSTNCVINYNPTKIHACGEIIEDVFPDKIPKTLNGCEIKLLGNTIAPYVINISANRNDPIKAGLETTLLHTLSKQLNFTDSYIKNKYKVWGNRLPNGTYTDMFTTIMDKNADFMFGMAGKRVEHIELDTLEIYVLEDLLWWVPVAGQEPVWKNFLNIYQPFMWLSILFIIIVNSIIWWIISKLTRFHKRNNFDLINSVLICVCSLLQLTVVPPYSASLKFLFIFWVAFTLILATAYQSQLVSILTQPRYEHQISSIEDVMNSKINFGFIPTIALFYSNPNSTIERYISNNFVTCPLTEECLNRTAFKRDFANVKNRRQALYMIKTYYSNPDGSSMLYGFENGMPVRPSIIVQRGYPLMKLFDPLITRLKENGIINHWDYDFTHVRRVQVKPVPTPLTISHLQYGFLLLAAGFCFSILVFFGEVFWDQVHKISPT